MEKVKISRGFSIIRNGANIKQNNESSGIPITRIETISEGEINTAKLGYADIFDEDKYRGYYLQQGDILMSHINSLKHLAKTAIVRKNLHDAKIIHGMNLLMLRAENKVLIPEFAKYYMITERFKQDIVQISNQSVNQCSFSISNLKNLEIPLPPLPVQKAIAARLDKAQEIIRTCRELIDKYDELTKSLFLDMFGDPVKNEKGWEKVKLGDCLDFLTSGSRGWAKYYSDSGDVFLRIQNVGYNRLKLNEINFVNSPDSAEAKRTKVKSGDIILSITADLGRTAVIPNDFPIAFINQHLAILRLNNKFNPHFVSAYIASEGGQILFGTLNKGGVKAGLNFNDIKSYKVFSPKLQLQNEFAARVQAIESQKLLAQESLEKSEELFGALLQGNSA